jgi:hypothetical protein
MVVMKVAIAQLPPGETVRCGGILSRLPGPGVRWRLAGVSLALVAPAASEVGRQPLTGLLGPAGVPNTMALAV